MKNSKLLLIIVILSLIYLGFSSSAALAATLVIDKQVGSPEPGIFHTKNYANDSACIQDALDKSNSGDTITITGGDYYLPMEVRQTGKSLNIEGKGEVTLHLRTPDRVVNDREIQSQILFNGSQVANPNISVNAYKDSSQIVLSDASIVRQYDLIKIWKNVQWCPVVDPNDYPDQMTGEMYAVKSVNGNTITLNQPLLRDYKLSEKTQIEVYRPVQIHVKNIRIEDDTGAGTLHHGLVFQFCRDSSVTDSWFNNSGFGAVCLYSCFNVKVNNNEIYNSVHSGCGYGINVASGSAFVNITNNYIKNCRHAVTGNSDELKSLNRDVFIADNTLIGANITGSNVVDAHAVTIDFIVIRNKIYPQLPRYNAFADGTQKSVFSSNEIFGGYGGIMKRGGLNDGVHIYENNIFNGMTGEMYTGGNGTDNTLIFRNNTQNKGGYGIYFPHQGSVRNIIINRNTFSNLRHQGFCQNFLINGVNLNISKNILANIRCEGIYIDGYSQKNGDIKIQDNILINVNTSNSSSGITIKNIQNAAVGGNLIFKVPAMSLKKSK